MSVLGPLYIPRKDILSVPKVKDNPELEKYLTDLNNRIHTNELMIERWANSAPRVAVVMGVCSTTTGFDSATTFEQQLILDGSTEANFAGIVSGNKIVIPQAGWYNITALVLWGTGGIIGDNNGSVEVVAYKNGDTVPTHEIASSGTAVTVEQAAGATYPSLSFGVDYQTITFTTTFAAKDTVELWGWNFIFTSVGGGTTIDCTVRSLSVDFLGSTPTKVQ